MWARLDVVDLEVILERCEKPSPLKIWNKKRIIEKEK